MIWAASDVFEPIGFGKFSKQRRGILRSVVQNQVFRYPVSGKDALGVSYYLSSCGVGQTSDFNIAR